MIDLTTLRELLTCVESATGPDREIDAAICVAIDGTEKSFTSANAPDSTRQSYSDGAWFTDADNYHVLSKTVRHAPLLTSSIDAAVALAERVLPGWKLCLTWGFSRPTAMIWKGKKPSIDRGAASMPLAISAAILSAVIAEKEKIK